MRGKRYGLTGKVLDFNTDHGIKDRMDRDGGDAEEE